jgi:regulator of RNase E activity RraA
LVNEPVDVGGITVNPGDLMAADLHGVINVPIDAVADILKISELEAKREVYVIGLCESGEEVTPDKLEEAFAKGNAVFEGPGAAY